MAQPPSGRSERARSGRSWTSRWWNRALGPGVVSGAADTDPSTVATLVVVGATTSYGLAWLTLLMMPAIAVVQILATRVGVLARCDLQQAVLAGYGRLPGALLLASVLAVNVVTIAADVAGGAAALGVLVGAPSRWLVVPFAAGLVALLVLGRYDDVERILKWVLLGLLVYGVAVVLARPDWLQVARGSLVPTLRLGGDHLAGALAIIGTTLTGFVYVWQTVEQVEQPPTGEQLRAREFDGVTGAVLAAAIFWSILVASGATLGAHGVRPDTAEQAAQALRPLAGPWAGALFALGLLASAIIAVPVIAASGAYVTAATFGWRRGLSRTPRQAPGFYAVIVVQAALGAALAMGGIPPIRLLFAASVVAGIGTPIGLVLLVLVAANPRLTNGHRIHRGLLAAGWAIAIVVALVALVYIAQQLHLLPG